MDVVQQVAHSISRYALGKWADRNLELAVDFDDVLFDYCGRYKHICMEGGFGDVSRYFTTFGELHKITPEVREYVNSREDFYDPRWIFPGALEMLEKLRANRVNPTIATACFRKQANSKLHLIDKSFGKYYEQHTIVTSEKNKILCDILCDDTIYNIRRFNSSMMGLGVLVATDHRILEPVPIDLENTSIDGIQELPDFIEALKQFII